MVAVLVLGTGLRLLARSPGFQPVTAAAQGPQLPAGILDGTAGAAETTTTTSTSTSTTTTTSTSTTTTTSTTVPEPPPITAGYIVDPAEVEVSAKQLAVDVALALTTYEQDQEEPEIDVESADALFRPGYWSRGSVVYPQYGGLRGDRASVMVVTRQIIGQGGETLEETTRTLDVRLVKDQAGVWQFDSLASDGGTPIERPADLPDIAVQVLDNPRIWLPDSARWDIYEGHTSTVLLEVMNDLAEQSPYGVITLTNGHPHHVFGTERQSHHTLGRAVDIFEVGDTEVIHGRFDGSIPHQTAQWLLAHPLVSQVGSPWDFDGRSSSRSFTDAVHQDHLHVAVNDN